MTCCGKGCYDCVLKNSVDKNKEWADLEELEFTIEEDEQMEEE